MEKHRAVVALQEMYLNQIGAKMKLMENQFEIMAEPKDYLLLRLDGVSFHTLLKGVNKPFDYRISDAMVRTTLDLVTKFNAVTGFTSSDEISLVFTPTHKLKKKRKQIDEVVWIPHPYNGRFQKLSSVAASYASARFNHHLMHPRNDWEDPLKGKLCSGQAFFDGRACKFDNPREVMESIYWRSNFDTFRNAVFQISAHYLKHDGTHGKSVIELLCRLKEEGIDVLNEWQHRYLFGTWVKRQRVEIEKLNPHNGLMVQCSRSRICCGSFNWAEWTDEERINFTTSKFWEADHPPTDEEVTNNLLQ
jgi:tRNA(His) 5'-end guanylyltransferase